MSGSRRQTWLLVIRGCYRQQSCSAVAPRRLILSQREHLDGRAKPWTRSSQLAAAVLCGSGRGDCYALVIRIQRGPHPALHLLHRPNRLPVLPCPASGRHHSQETTPKSIDAVGTGRLSCHLRSITQGAGRTPPFAQMAAVVAPLQG